MTGMRVLAGALVVVLGVSGCGSSPSASSSATSRQQYLAEVSGSTSGSGINNIPPSTALTLGLGICSSLEGGQSPAQVADGFYTNTKGQFPAEAAAELMVDAALHLCPHYFGAVEAWASPS